MAQKRNCPENTLKPTKQKRCGACKTLFPPVRPLQAACSPICAIAIAQDREKLKRLRAAHTKADRQQNRKDRQAFNEKDRQWWLSAKNPNGAVRCFNAYIRLRDKDLPCISCGRHESKIWHAGHYRPAHVNSMLAFDEENVNKQCANCNTHNSGNLTGYEAGLIAKIGLEKVEALKNNHDVKRWTCDELREIRDKYKSLSKEM